MNTLRVRNKRRAASDTVDNTIMDGNVQSRPTKFIDDDDDDVENIRLPTIFRTINNDTTMKNNNKSGDDENKNGKLRTVFREQIVYKPKRMFGFCVLSMEIIILIFVIAMMFRSNGSDNDSEARKFEAVVQKLQRLKKSFEKFNDMLSLPNVDGSAVFRKSEAGVNATEIENAVETAKKALEDLINATEQSSSSSSSSTEQSPSPSPVEFDNETSTEFEMSSPPPPSTPTTTTNDCNEELDDCFIWGKDVTGNYREDLKSLVKAVWEMFDDWSTVIERRMVNATVAGHWKEKLKNATVEVESRTAEVNSTLVDLSDLLARIKNVTVVGQ